ncbi:hypothetical protein VL04_04790 [Chromobacterium violaceum]|uniref:hypothetical protein n=1 Tax=Chromobacterium violaceum TaxID=536 RepID=UPI000652D6A3|nr:hypothetical protein [Chromobacterium violaceum]KMN48387.1 hypothetical protein VK93_15560 [Chromobacterium violaceum]KMN85711.1 hypothetical protein VL02_14060 [Chromobacterium violaceum]KMN91616.1 hypothetical protein VL04_04790 [Chromobacterium violaceum]KMO05800.1 hypothetical protein VL16_01505 [Chromobacterium violaceum]
MKTPIASLLAILSLPAAAACSLPQQLDGKTFINVADPAFSPGNPNAGTIMKLRFSKDDYENKILTRNLVVHGQYRYRRLHDTVGFVEASENYGGQPTRYTLVLTCLNDYSGTAVFTQTQGAVPPDHRQNTVRYTIEQ